MLGLGQITGIKMKTRSVIYNLLRMIFNIKVNASVSSGSFLLALLKQSVDFEDKGALVSGG